MAELDFHGRVAVVTGAGNGLGRAHALELARRGAQVVVNDLGSGLDGGGGSQGPAAEVVGLIRDAGGEAIADTGDISVPEGARSLLARTLDTFGHIDIVVNNAGILRDRSFAKMEPEDFDRVLAVHLKGSYLVTREAWPHLRERGYGRIVMTSSPAGVFGNFGQANYASAKAGVIGLTKTLAIEGARRGIGVNAIAPIARTRMTEAMLPPDSGDLFATDQVSALATWLSHENCRSTGDVFNVGGGRITRILYAEGPLFDQVKFTAEDIGNHWPTLVGES